jgi:hypothetical protein
VSSRRDPAMFARILEVQYKISHKRSQCVCLLCGYAAVRLCGYAAVLLCGYAAVLRCD